MSQFNALEIGVSLAGVSTVLAGLAALTNSIQNTSKQADKFSAAAAAFTAGAAVMSAASLRAYDSFARFQMGAESLIGVLEGQKFSKAIQKMAVMNAYSADILRKGSQGFLASGMSASMAQSVLSATTNIAAAGGSTNEELSRTFLALRQINSKGSTVRAEEANQQLAESLPLLAKAVQDITGKQSIVGMSKDEFFNALIRAGNERYGGAQDELAKRSPAIAWQNTVDNLKNALIPTGMLLAKALGFILKPINALISAFGALNEKTGGLAGLAVIFGMLKGASLMLGAFVRTIVGVTKAEWEQLTILGRVNVALIAFQYRLNGALLGKTATAGSSTANSVHNISDVLADYAKSKGFRLNPNSSSPLGTLGQLDILARFKKLPTQSLGLNLGTGSLVDVISGIWKGIVEFFSGFKIFANLGKFAKVGIWTTVIMLAIEVIPKLLGNLAKIFGALWNVLVKAYENFMKTPVGAAIATFFEELGWIWDQIVSILSLDWLVKLLGIEDKPDTKNAELIAEKVNGSQNLLAPNRPIRKSDAETWMYTRLSEMR